MSTYKKPVSKPLPKQTAAPTQPTIPNPSSMTCTCRGQVKLLCVQKEGENKGKYFYTCYGCKAFNWANPDDDVVALTEKVVKQDFSGADLFVIQSQINLLMAKLDTMHELLYTMSTKVDMITENNPEMSMEK